MQEDERKLELAKLIKERVSIIGTCIKHIESITKYSAENKQFEEAFAALLAALQNYVYIELFKLFDSSGKDSNKYTVYALIDMADDDNKTYRKKISKFKKDIGSIRERRNHIFAHELGIDGNEIFNKNPIASLQELLQCVADICHDINCELCPNTYVSNARCFDKWCYMAIDSISKICKQNDSKLEALLKQQSLPCSCSKS